MGQTFRSNPIGLISTAKITDIALADKTALGTKIKSSMSSWVLHSVLVEGVMLEVAPGDARGSRVGVFHTSIEC